MLIYFQDFLTSIRKIIFKNQHYLLRVFSIVCWICFVGLGSVCMHISERIRPCFFPAIKFLWREKNTEHHQLIQQKWIQDMEAQGIPGQELFDLVKSTLASMR